MSNFKLYIEYEGTRFSGWQIQKNSRTVQGELIVAIKKVFNVSELDFQGSGRTDAGVHALRQVAHLEVKGNLAPDILRMKLNDELPADINILGVEKALKNFHARHDAVSRSYIYQISRRRTAFGKKYVWWIKDKLDLENMKQAAELFIGMKNFQSFTDDNPEEKSTKVMIEDIQVKEAGDLILIRIIGSHFIWKMVRRVVGVIAEVGRGDLSLEKVKTYINTKSNEPARLTAPPSGLFLEQVIYKGDKKNPELTPLINIT
ncbi:MAG: tRNA pseudouridine(38-40) synthase TruA [Nitrospira sp.]|nr:tRNA pseudouridine(38-40) synthase TruA [Nitrospira sp.]